MAEIKIQDRSQSGEIILLFELLKDHPKPLVVDVGANNGVKYSNSFALLQLGWLGLLVEPNPQNAKKITNLYKDNEKVAIAECAASNFIGSTKLFSDHLGLDAESLGSTISTDENEWSEKVINRDSFIDVKTDTISNLILKTGFGDRDFALLSIDTEGHDLEVLEGLGHFRPSIIITERHLWDMRKALKKQQLLTTYGYVFGHHIGCNEIYFYVECSHLNKKLEFINSKLPYLSIKKNA